MVGVFKVRQTVEIFEDISVVERIMVICPLWLLFVTSIIVILKFLGSGIESRISGECFMV